jgi:hypothetical protein
MLAIGSRTREWRGRIDFRAYVLFRGVVQCIEIGANFSQHQALKAQ